MQALTIMLALVAAFVEASIKHDGKEHIHPVQSRQVPGLGVLASPSPAVTASIFVPTISTYLFSTTVIQIPVTTVCPDTPPVSAAFSVLPVSSLVSMAAINTTQDSNKTLSYIPIQVNATALLPNGNTTVFLSASSTAISLSTSISLSSTDTAGVETARIILDNNGCQTVYSALTTSYCSTTIKPAGMLPVSITDCNQWITFSSQRLDGCSSTSMPAPSSSGAADGPVAFYVAHWYDLVQGDIPNQVQVEDCLPNSTGLDCVTSSESWDVVSSTTTSTGTSVASFVGPAVITVSGMTLMTALSFESTATTTTVVTNSAIEKTSLGLGAAGIGTGQTVTVLATMPTTLTLSLDSLTKTTVTIRQTSTLQVTETRTLSISDALPPSATAANAT